MGCRRRSNWPGRRSRVAETVERFGGAQGSRQRLQSSEHFSPAAAFW